MPGFKMTQKTVEIDGFVWHLYDSLSMKENLLEAYVGISAHVRAKGLVASAKVVLP
jgi:hypothetical protein